MTNDLKDPKLTAYALGELNEAETKEIEQKMAKDPSLRAEVESIKSFALLMKSELAEESTPNLEVEKKEELQEAVTNKKSIFSMWLAWSPSTKAAMGTAFLMVVCFVGLKQLNLTSPDSLGTAKIALEEAPTISNVKESLPEASKTGAEEIGPGVGVGAGGLGKQKQVAVKAKKVAKSPSIYHRKKSTIMAKKPMSQSKSQKVNPHSVGMLGVFSGNKAANAGRELKMRGQVIGVGNIITDQSSRQRFEGKATATVASVYRDPLKDPLSTFSVDVDTASYTLARRHLLKSSFVPPRSSVRTEEFINYFRYSDPKPVGEHPFSVNLELSDSPWNKGYQIVRVALKGKTVQAKERKKNLVFLIDTSGSMAQMSKLPLLKDGLSDLLDKLGKQDRISIVTYAGSAGVKLPPTPGDQKQKILNVLKHLSSRGGTNGAAGIEEAYRLAKSQFIKNGVNRVILATDGDFNVGMSSQDGLKSLIKEKAKEGVDLTVLGFGSGNFRDNLMEEISNHGNGNYFYIDSDREARKVLVEGLNGTLVTIAKDVKLQVEFNPNYVQSYRLIGYKNRRLKNEDFNNDRKDAGDIGAGHSVVALYEIIPQGLKLVDDLKYQKNKVVKVDKSNPELLTVKLRYKKPKESKSRLLTKSIKKEDKKAMEQMSNNFKWTMVVASFAELLSGAEPTESLSYDRVLEFGKPLVNDIANDSQSRQEFIDMVKKTRRLKGQR